MPRRRRCLILTLGLLVCLLLAGGAVVLWPRTAITRENAAHIQPGMTVADVEAIMGGPARDEVPDRSRPLILIQSVKPDLEWYSDEVRVWVHLDGAGRVKESQAVPVPPQGLLGAVRRWLRL